MIKYKRPDHRTNGSNFYQLVIKNFFREVFYDMLEHHSRPCEDSFRFFFDQRGFIFVSSFHFSETYQNAIKEVTRLSKATLNNLRGKSRKEGVRHGLKDKKRKPIGSQGSSTSSSLPVTPSTPATPEFELSKFRSSLL